MVVAYLVKLLVVAQGDVGSTPIAHPKEGIIMGKKYSTPEQMDKAVDDYVETCRLQGKPLTMTGLALHLGFSNRNAVNYYKKFPEFVDSVERAKLFVENQYEMNLMKRGTSPVGSIFALKQFGWKDKTEVEVSGEQEFIEFVLALTEKKKEDGKTG